MLTLNGKPLDLHPLPANVAALIAYLETLEPMALLDSAELARAMGKTIRAMQYIAHEGRPEILEVTHMLENYPKAGNRTRVWGRRGAIEALKAGLR